MIIKPKLQSVHIFYSEHFKVGNIWFSGPLIPSKWESLAFLSFEESGSFFKFLSDRIYGYVFIDIIVNSIIQNWKINHFPQNWEKLSSLIVMGWKDQRTRYFPPYSAKTWIIAHSASPPFTPLYSKTSICVAILCSVLVSNWNVSKLTRKNVNVLSRM